MDKKILMLGLVISGNVFGMNNNTDFSDQCSSQSPENKIERRYHYDKCKLESFSGIFSSLEGHPYGFQLSMGRVFNELNNIMKHPINIAEQLALPIFCLFSGYDSIKNFYQSEYYSEGHNKTFLMLFHAATFVFNELDLSDSEQKIVNRYKQHVQQLNEDNIIQKTSCGYFPTIFGELSYIIDRRIIWE